MKYLKNSYKGWVLLIVFLNVCIYYSFHLYGEYRHNKIQEWSALLKDSNSYIALGVPLISMLLLFVLSARLKEILVFWKVNNPLPGSRAFSELLTADSRVDVSALKIKYNEFPNEPHAQNSLWYSMYRKHTANPMIQNSHRDYLFFRDWTALAFIFFIVLGVFSCFLIEVSMPFVVYVFCLGFQFLFASLAGKNAGNRFVSNVLVEESQFK